MKNKTKNAFQWVLVLSQCLAFGSASMAKVPEAQKKQVKVALTNLSQGDRNALLGRAEIFNSKYNPDQVAAVDLIAETEKDCGFKYDRGANELIWPRVECRFHPDTEKSLGGGSSKFLCDFPDDDKVKVRYAPRRNPFEGESEVLETILGYNMAKLVGFPAKHACPVELTCLNCPNSDPWGHKALFRGSDHSSAPGRDGQREFFQFAMYEKNIKGFHLSTRTGGNAPNGVLWPELKMVSENLDPVDKRRMLIEREVMMLWIQFLMNPDAGAFNNRLSCYDRDMTANVDATGRIQFQCARPVAYVHDYGHAFYEHFQFDNYVRSPVLVSDARGCYGVMTQDNIRGIRKNTPLLKDGSEFLLGARFSAEARNELAQRLRRITDEQWRDLYLLARVERAQRDAGLNPVSVQGWISGIKQKIRSMEEARCLPFDEGSSALGLRNAVRQ